MQLSEDAGSPTEIRDDLRFSLRATRKMRCDWADRYEARSKLMSPTPSAEVPLGWLYPYSTAYGARAFTCQIDGEGKIGQDASGLATYKQSVLTVQYETPGLRAPAEDDNGEIITESFERTVEFLTLDHRLFNWGPNPFGGVFPLEPDEAPGIQIHGMIYTLGRHNLAFVKQEFIDLEGSINSTPMQTRRTGTPRLTFGAESVLYSPPQVSIEHQADGSLKYGVDLKFTWRRVPSWNLFLRAASYSSTDANAVWKPLYTASGAQFKPYPVKSHAPLFT